MPIEKPAEMTSMENEQLPVLNEILDSFARSAMSIKYTSILPTATTASEGELIVYDDGAAVPTKRLYFITGKKNLGYVALT